MPKVVYLHAEDRFFSKLENWKGYVLFCVICFLATAITIHKA